MQQNYPTIVRRGGFFSAAAYGLFGFLTATVVCVAGLGVFTVHVVDRKIDTLLGSGRGALLALPEVLPEVQKALPPALADALNDRRAPDYRPNLALDVRVVPDHDPGWQEMVLSVHNQGKETVSLLAVGLLLVDDGGVPVRSIVTYAATPISLDQSWRGPILPGSVRECVFRLREVRSGLTARAEITDIRIWCGQQDASSAVAVVPTSGRD